MILGNSVQQFWTRNPDSNLRNKILPLLLILHTKAQWETIFQYFKLRVQKGVEDYQDVVLKDNLGVFSYPF